MTPTDNPFPDPATTRLTVDLSALAGNWRRMRNLSGGARCGAAVKADAYGTGAAEAAPRLYREGCRDFFVADAGEAARLRPLIPEARLYVLNGVFDGSFALTLAHDLIPIVNSPEQAAFWRANAALRPYALHIDTGMNRLGLTPQQADALSRDGGPQPALVMSHFACADEPDHPLNARQIEMFAALKPMFPGIEASLANSAGIGLGADAHHDLTRPGIALYGGAPGADPVVTAETQVLMIRKVKAGATVSYGAAGTVSRDSRIAVCGVGYADGFLRNGSGAGVPLRQAVPNGAAAMFDGVRLPVIGKITMDLTMFDVTDLPEGAIKESDWIELIGPGMPLADVAEAAGTITYEVLTALGRRYSRHYAG